MCCLITVALFYTLLSYLRPLDRDASCNGPDAHCHTQQHMHAIPTSEPLKRAFAGHKGVWLRTTPASQSPRRILTEAE